MLSDVDIEEFALGFVADYLNDGLEYLTVAEDLGQYDGLVDPADVDKVFELANRKLRELVEDL